MRLVLLMSKIKYLRKVVLTLGRIFRTIFLSPIKKLVNRINEILVVFLNSSPKDVFQRARARKWDLTNI